MDKNTDVKTLLALSKKIQKIGEEELSKIPFHLNVISIAAKGKLKETAHSLILQKLLKDQTILNSFKNIILGLNNHQIDARHVQPAEKDRIDVSIKDLDNKIYVIIENKVNNAKEECGQVYRYVEKATLEGFTKDQIKVLYLNSIGHSKPTDYSLTENGAGQKYIHLPKSNLIIKDYANDIYMWVQDEYEKLLQDSKINLKSEKWPLVTALFQYKDYLERYFHKTDDFAKMKRRMKETITSEILPDLNNENDFDISQRISRLQDTIDELEHLKEHISYVKEDLEKDQIFYFIRCKLMQMGLSVKVITNGNYEWGVPTTINNASGFIVYGYDYDNKGKLYVGLKYKRSEFKSDLEEAYLLRLYQDSGFKNSGQLKESEKEDWICFDYIEENELINQFCKLVSFFYNHKDTQQSALLQFIQ